MNSPKLDYYQLYTWLNHHYDDKLIRHQVIEDIYQMIFRKINSMGLELKITEDELYQKLIHFIVNQTNISNK